MAKDNPLPPLDLKEVEKWLLTVEETAATERDCGFAARLILINLIAALDRAKVLDVKGLLMSIKIGLHQIEEMNYRIATEVLVEELLAILKQQEHDESSYGKLIH